MQKTRILLILEKQQDDLEHLKAILKYYSSRFQEVEVTVAHSIEEIQANLAYHRFEIVLVHRSIMREPSLHEQLQSNIKNFKCVVFLGEEGPAGRLDEKPYMFPGSKLTH